MMSDSFNTGVLVGLLGGLVIGGILGWFWNMYRLWVRDRDAARKPQMVLHPTAKTPTQVIEAAARAQAKIWLARIFIFVIVPWILIELFWPGAAQMLNETVAELWHMFWG